MAWCESALRKILALEAILSGARNVLILAICQALALSCGVLAVTAGALVGRALAADPALATLPVALTVVGTLLATMPASQFMHRVGRRVGFALGALIGVASGLVCAAGILVQSFALFAAGNLMIGIFQAFVGYFRFAAAESVPESFRSRAIAWVLAGGVIAALLGPQLATWGHDFVPKSAFAGSYLLMATFCVALTALVLGLDLPRAVSTASASAGRSLAQIARQPVFVVAVTGATVGYAVMLLVMTATPLAMVQHQHQVGDAVRVIQAHVLAMFAPSFFSGALVRRFGALPMMLAGLALLAAHVAVAAAGVEFAHFFWALVLLGAGWNFSFVAGTALLTEAYTEAERGKAQAANEFILSGCVALASLSSGWLLHAFGWRAVALSGLPFLVVAAALALWLRRLGVAR